MRGSGEENCGLKMSPHLTKIEYVKEKINK